MSTQDIDAQLGKGGATIHQHADRRVTRFIDWLLATIGGIVLLLVWRAGDTLVDIKVSVATLTARADSKDKRDDEQDRRLNVLEEKQFRGVDGFDKVPRRGN